jgi:hypothetical protein
MKSFPTSKVIRLLTAVLKTSAGFACTAPTAFTSVTLGFTGHFKRTDKKLSSLYETAH